MKSERFFLPVLVLFFLVAAGVSAAEPDFFDDFESYEVDEGLPDDDPVWGVWDGNQAVDGTISDDVAFSGEKCLVIDSDDDVVALFEITEGIIEISAMVYIPSGHTGTAYFILMNQYTEGGDPKSWALELHLDTTPMTITAAVPAGGASLQLVADEWVEIKVLVDLNTNQQYVYYNEEELLFNAIFAPNDVAELAAIDLYAGPGSTAAYIDDVRVSAGSLPPFAPVIEAPIGPVLVLGDEAQYKQPLTILGEPAPDIVITPTGVTYEDGVLTYDILSLPDSFTVTVTATNSEGQAEASWEVNIIRDSIILSDIVGGGDGRGNAPVENTGISQDTGFFQQTIHNAATPNTTAEPLQFVEDSDYIDSVFIMNGLVNPPDMEITTEGALYSFSSQDVFDSYGYILKDVTHDIDKGITDIWAGGDNSWQFCIAVHAAAGITFDLFELREEYGPLDTFSCFAGTDQCAGSNLNLYVILSSDSDGDEAILADESRSILGLTANTGEEITIEIPPEAMFLTLAAGAANGSIGCDHGVFANPLITYSDGPSGPQFVRGDVNGDGAINIADAISLLSHLFGGAGALACDDAGDANDDGAINIADAISILSHLFAGAGDLPDPFGGCGIDPSEDVLDCGSFASCE